MRRVLGAAIAASFVGSLVLLGGGTPVAAATVVAGFSDTAVAPIAAGTTVEWLPDSRIVALEQEGRVRIGTPDGSFSTALTVVNVCPGSERGLLGFTHDPAFMSNGLVYLYYTRDAAGAPGGCVNRVSRFTLSAGVIDPLSEVVLLDNISSVNGNHNGGDLDFGSDGLLYVAVGDAGRDPRGDSGSAGANDAAQDLSLLNGKILRITRDGQPAPGNPISGPSSAACATRGNTPSTPVTPCQEIFAWGLRNPYRFAFDRKDGSDRFFINDVGQGTYEEVDLGAAGVNYGWPMREGGCPQGDTTPCPGPAAGLTDPITFYGRDLGTFITAGAFVPSGLWPAEYDGAYLFADGGSGDIWVRFADGSLDYGAPFATGAGGISDMTFGFDSTGRMVLYYVQNGGGLRKITPTGAPASSVRNGLQMTPITPFRAYDTGTPDIPAVGVAPGDVFNGTTRHVDLEPPAAYEAALINVTYADNPGVGFVKLFGTRSLRPATSSLNADAAGTFGANTAVVPLDAEGTFMLEATMTGRVLIDVMAWFDATGAPVSAGRMISLPTGRLIDTRLAPGTQHPGLSSDNSFTETQDVIEFPVGGRIGVPADGSAAAVVLSVGAIAGESGGFIGGYPSGGTWSGTSNVNVTPGDVRANMLVIPLGADGRVALRRLNVPDVVVDVLGYVTSSTAAVSTSGLYHSVEPFRLVDTRIDLGITELGHGTAQTITVPGSEPAGAVVQNVTVTQAVAPGYLSTFQAASTSPLVSTVNFFPGQTRATLAITTIDGSRRVSYEALVPSEAVVDVIGFFSA